MINQAKTLHDQLEQIGGCGDGSCIVHIRPGMHTNGGCRCNREPYKMSRVIYWHKRAVAEQAQQIASLTAENERLREALETIQTSHVPDQPASRDVDPEKYIHEHHTKLRRIARAALQPKEGNP